jgi:cold shock CspA family protein
VVVVEVGRILRFDDARGYGFIAPSNGGDDVFFHANDFGDQRQFVRPDMRVEFEAEAGDRGLKVASVRLLDGPGRLRSDIERAFDGAADRLADPADDGMCDVLAPRQFAAEITELLVTQVPSLTGAQILQIRQHLADHARSHGWVEA